MIMLLIGLAALIFICLHLDVLIDLVCWLLALAVGACVLAAIIVAAYYML